MKIPRAADSVADAEANWKNSVPGAKHLWRRMLLSAHNVGVTWQTGVKPLLS